MLRYLFSAGMRTDAAHLFVALLSCLLLAHCGGGGSGGTQVTQGGTPPAPPAPPPPTPPVPTVSLAANPTDVPSGQSSTLTWSSTGATSCSATSGPPLAGWSGSKATSGSQGTGALTAGTNFSITCSGAGGSQSASATVTVQSTMPPPAVPTVSIAANPTTVANGFSSALTWSSTNATSCSASGAWSGAKATSGASVSTGILHASGNFSLSCTGPGGTASATANVKVLGVFPLRVEANKRYLIDAEGNPFLLQGDAAWDLITQLNDSDVDLYLEDRRQKGFNAVIVRLIDHHFSPNPPFNDAGDSPFIAPCTVAAQNCDFSVANLNSVYFDHANSVINKAAEKGILVLLAPAYTGFLGLDEGWFQEMQVNGTTKLQLYGDYVGNRYKNFTNILWVNGGDYSPDNAGKDLVRAVANGILGKIPGALQTFHGGRHTPALGFWFPPEPWLTVNDIYTDENDVFDMAKTEYNRSTMPFFMIENRYENEPVSSPPGASAALVRTQAYQAALTGATGYFMGNFPMWDFATDGSMNPLTDWKAALNSGAASTLKYLRILFEGRAWHTLLPDLSNNLLIGGIGVDKDRAVAANAGTFAIAYVPAVRQITIDPSQLNGPNVQAKWCDPTNGVCTAAGAPFAKISGTKNFTPAGNNSGGFGDWVLLLESIQ
jgi:uncharacterized protein DUF4038/collagenase-like protein with putative collagen-binding domain